MDENEVWPLCPRGAVDTRENFAMAGGLQDYFEQTGVGHLNSVVEDGGDDDGGDGCDGHDD